MIMGVKTKKLAIGLNTKGKRGYFSGGADQDRTGDLLNAIQALSQLSYSPTGVRLYYSKTVCRSRKCRIDHVPTAVIIRNHGIRRRFSMAPSVRLRSIVCLVFALSSVGFLTSPATAAS